MLISAVLIGLTGMAVAIGVSAAMRAQESLHGTVNAVNLLRRSQEEVRRIASLDPINYSNIGQAGCTFAIPNACGFADISALYPGYQRTLTVTNEAAGGGLKHVRIDVSWNDFQTPRTLSSVMLLARPRDPLPGNIAGLVTNSSDGTPILNVQVGITKGSLAVSASSGTPSGAPLTNFSFLNSSGQFQLPPGTWRLMATRAGFITYGPVDVTVSSNVETIYNFSMDPVPADATIKGAFFLNGTAQTPALNNYTTYLRLYRNGAEQQRTRALSSFNFTISFSDTQPQCFTLATDTTFYYSGYLGTSGCSGFVNEYRGWSSAVDTDFDSVADQCGNPWVGNSAIENVSTNKLCVSPGDQVIQNIFVVPVPTTTVTGKVSSDGAQNNGIAGATVYWRWPNGGTYTLLGSGNPPFSVRTDTGGLYSLVVPALQSFLPNVSSNYAQMRASASVPVTQCCNILSSTLRYSPASGWDRVGPLPPPASKNFVIDLGSIVNNCGSAQGQVIDVSTGAGLPGVSVVLGGLTRTTDGSGNYSYTTCPDGVTPHPLTVGSYGVTAVRKDSGGQDIYYAYSSAGNSYYNSSGNVAITANNLKLVPDIGLWPIGQGTLKVLVKRANETLIPGAAVVGTGPQTLSGSTDGNGEAVFSLIRESWPPTNLPFPNFYNFKSTVNNYTINVSHSAYVPSVQSDVAVTPGDETLRTFTLIPLDGM